MLEPISHDITHDSGPSETELAVWSCCVWHFFFGLLSGGDCRRVPLRRHVGQPSEATEGADRLLPADSGGKRGMDMLPSSGHDKAGASHHFGKLKKWIYWMAYTPILPGIINPGCDVSLLIVPIEVFCIFRTWLCLHVYQPCVELVLQPLQMCLRVAEVGHKAQVVSSANHWWGLFAVGRSFQVSSDNETDGGFFWLPFPRVLPSWVFSSIVPAWQETFTVLSASSWRHTASTTISLLSDVDALCQVGL